MINSIKNKQKILEIFLNNSLLNSWNNESLKEAVLEAGFSEGDSNIIFEKGIYSFIDFFIDEGNKKLEERVVNIDLNSLKIRDKIKELVKTRLLIEENNKRALRNLTTISKGQKIPNLLKNSYRIADKMWEVSGDRATDFNFYTKRLILSKVFSKTLLYFIQDNSADNQKTWDFLDKEIEKVMKIGKVKKQMNDYIEKVKECVVDNDGFLKEKISKLPFIRLINRKK